jgi:hypothetical protein
MNDQKGKFRAVLKQWLGSAGAPCHGYWGLYVDKGDGALTPINIKGLKIDTDMGADAEVEIEWSFRVVKRGKVPTKKCMNPWPAHSHDKEK